MQRVIWLDMIFSKVDVERIKFRDCLDAFQSNSLQNHLVAYGCTLTKGNKVRYVPVKACEFEHTRK